MAALELGNFDPGKKPSNLKTFLKPYHTDGVLKTTDKFRDDDNNRFVEWKEGEKIQELQEFLYTAGFMNQKYNEGVFDYVTEASVRLFQEYIRTIDPADSNFVRDGKVGNGTWGQINKWPARKKCEWHVSRSEESSMHQEYNNWFELLKTAKEHYSKVENQGPIMKSVNEMNDTKSTLKVESWDFDKDKIHLIGIRRNESKSVRIRTNDDLFILLINGMVFKFWGSTDPKSKDNPSLDEPFLVEGQHIYRFGWHRLAQTSGNYVTYRALRPFINEQVVVIRDWKDDNKLSEEDLIANNGLGYGGQINIHWTGTSRSKSTWSSGCQVIRGQSYINNRGKAIDLSKFTAKTYADLYNSDKIDKGAYNMLADLVVCYSKKGLNQLYYTLGNEKETLPMIKTNFGENYVISALEKMKANEANS